MRDLLPKARPALVLAPMQDVTDWPFMRIIARYGGPDFYVTEYFRVHETSHLDKRILRSVDENPTGRPLFAQMIGSDPVQLRRTAKLLENHPVAGIDLNLGCPAPVVCRKCSGGGLLKTPEKIDQILGVLREAVQGRLTVKTRLGFESPGEFEGLLEVFSRHAIDGLTIHGRTVREGYRTAIHPDMIRLAVEQLPCPVIANGNVVSVATALALLERTGASGIMIGRGAIRNPWIFGQIRAAMAGETTQHPTREQLMVYVRTLYEETKMEGMRFSELRHVQKMKKYLAFIAQGVDPEGAFERAIRRAQTPVEFHALCKTYLNSREPLPHEPPTSSKLFCGFSDLTAPACH